MTYYEWLTPLGPEAAAILAGYLVPWIDGRLWLTPLGEAYLEFAERYTSYKQSER